MSFSFTNRELYFHIYGHTLTFISVKKYFKSFQSFKLTVKLKNLVTIEKWELEIYIYHKWHISLPITLPFYFFFTYQTLPVNLNRNTSEKKRIHNFLPIRKFCWYATFNFHSLLNMLYNMFVHIISEPFDLDQMPMS